MIVMCWELRMCGLPLNQNQRTGNWEYKPMSIPWPGFSFLLASIVFIIWTTMKFRIVTCQSVSYKHMHLWIVSLFRTMMLMTVTFAHFKKLGLECFCTPKYSVLIMVLGVGGIFVLGSGGLGGCDGGGSLSIYIPIVGDNFVSDEPHCQNNPILALTKKSQNEKSRALNFIWLMLMLIWAAAMSLRSEHKDWPITVLWRRLTLYFGKNKQMKIIKSHKLMLLSLTLYKNPSLKILRDIMKHWQVLPS